MEHRERMEAAGESGQSFARKTAVLVGTLAALLSIATLFANAAGEEIILNQERATDTYNEFQADSLKQRIGNYDSQILGALNQPAQAAAAKKDATDKGALKDELLKKAREFEHERDVSARKHLSFQLSEAAFQIGIVVASIAIVARLVALVWAGGILGLAGLLLLLNGLLNLVKLH